MFLLAFIPERASTMAGRVDALYFALVGLGGTVALGIAIALIWMSVRYRRGSPADRSPVRVASWKIELVWIIVPGLFMAGIFFWAAREYFTIMRPPPDTLDIYVTGRQWMWKAQHPTGHREINALHVPVNQPVKLTMTSEDVIHSFYVPAFRIKMDVLPGRYTTLWFEATRPGRYHLFCAEYCGTEHAFMIGSVVVLEPAEYQAWLQRGGQAATAAGIDTQASAEGPASEGQRLFIQMGCNTCHVPDSTLRAPALEGLWGSQVTLSNDEIVIADEQYIRQSILDPNAQIVAGYPQPSLMPSYQGQLTNQQLNDLIAYIRSLGDTQESRP